MTKEQVLEEFDKGYDCCQVVFRYWAEKLNMDTELAYKVSSGFGAGMFQGETCGAVIGAYMACPPEILEKSWSKNMIWYGPGGIGASYTIPRYQEQHQLPFRNRLTDKKFNGHVCRFAEGNFACFFGWPNLTNRPLGGFLGMPGGQVKADMQVVDVYCREGDKLSENWVLIDLPYWLKQQGLDILERTQQIYNA